MDTAAIMDHVLAAGKSIEAFTAQIRPIAMDQNVVLSIAIGYFILVQLVNPPSKSQPVKLGTAVTFLVFLHNVALCAYSAWTFYNTGPVWIQRLLDGENFFHTFCDLDGVYWKQTLDKYAYLFYLSKYYEFIDTVILLMKNRRVGLLQSYHHTGAVITMFLLVESQATACWIFVVFNSFIHTIMYAYYAASTIGIHFPFKQLITISQITQFLVGSCFGVFYIFCPGCAKRLDEGFSWGSERTSIAVTVVYLIPLTYLFFDFAFRTYGKKARSSKSNGHTGKPLKEE
ncbi:very-long-chain 3-oxoacyl-CoA synthase [Synchytrium microbalum]|uniref:Elongation of fatty acids protein n=1 Tax=Synchytrium microbalum TaxID=1806994 RepID=A0A507CDN2_9FUNG|nr:very-long-chain 3-oxoacyl-CoA synthase [Synchytrium microbalum]TPX37448.1 very-long-chain 3-oxoacyl-CoA synthase [Synchytrium microbalum]